MVCGGGKRLAGILFVVIFGWGCSCDDDTAISGLDGQVLSDGGRDQNDGEVVQRSDAGGRCSEIQAIVRDFDVSHSDFEDENPGFVAGLVRDTLDEQSKPVYAHGNERRGNIENAESFTQWYRDVDGVNQRFEIGLPLRAAGGGSFVYDDDTFFPVDGRGFGNSGTDHEGNERNFHFTTEIHTSFTYEGGETFTFEGDDDLWLFVDGELVIDLGGVHGVLDETADIDTLGLVRGQKYSMDIFHAERHTVRSNFRIETTIECFEEPVLR